MKGLPLNHTSKKKNFSRDCHCCLRAGRHGKGEEDDHPDERSDSLLPDQAERDRQGEQWPPGAGQTDLGRRVLCRHPGLSELSDQDRSADQLPPTAGGRDQGARERKRQGVHREETGD